MNSSDDISLISSSISGNFASTPSSNHKYHKSNISYYSTFTPNGMPSAKVLS